MKVENTRWAIAIYNQVLTYYNVKCSRQNVLFKNISTLYNFSFIILLVSGVFFLLKIYWRLETESLVFRDRAQRELEIHRPEAPGKDNFRLCPQQTIGPWPSTAAKKLTNLCEHVFFFFFHWNNYCYTKVTKTQSKRALEWDEIVWYFVLEIYNMKIWGLISNRNQFLFQ